MTQTPAQPSIANLATEEEAGPHCVMCFNVTEPTGGGGIGGDVATVSAMGGHSLPVVTGVLIRDSAQVYEHHALDDELIVEQARTVLEDMSISAWKVGFLGNPENVSAVAEILSDYADLPLVVYLPSMGWQDEAQQFAYHEALRELVLPQAHILVGHYQTLIERVKQEGYRHEWGYEPGNHPPPRGVSRVGYERWRSAEPLDPHRGDHGSARLPRGPARCATGNGAVFHQCPPPR